MAKQATVVLCGLVFLHVALACTIISLATPHWVHGSPNYNNSIFTNSSLSNATNTNETSRGLWEVCMGEECVVPEEAHVPRWLKVVQSLYTVGTGATLFAVVGAYVFCLITSCSKSMICNLLNTLILMVAAALQVTALGIFGAHAKKDIPEIVTTHFGWSFFMAAIGAIFTGFGALMHVWEGCILSDKRAAYESI